MLFGKTRVLTFSKKINETIYNNNKIVIKLNSQSNDICGVFWIRRNGSLKLSWQ